MAASLISLMDIPTNAAHERKFRRAAALPMPQFAAHKEPDHVMILVSSACSGR